MKIKNLFLPAVLFFILLVGGKCTEKEVVDDVESKCEHIGIVKDLTGLDGCGLVIESEGKIFEPAELPAGEELHAGDVISFSYEVFDGASICMVGKLISVTCLEKLDSTVPPCRPIMITQLDSVLAFPKSNYKLNSYKINNHKLVLNITYSGCGNNNDQILFVSKAELKSLPPQRTCILSFKPQPCEALVTTDVCFDLSSIKYETILLLKTEAGAEKIRFTP